MNKEKFILIFSALGLGLLVAVGAFFLYQKTKAIAPRDIPEIVISSPSPTPSENSLIVDSPKDEAVISSASVSVSGRADPSAKILIVSQTTQQAADSTSTGAFTATIGLESGENIIMIIAVLPNGETFTVRRTVTVSSESF